MPHIHLKIAAGQSEENKQKLADLFTKVITENTENPEGSGFGSDRRYSERRLERCGLR